MCLSTVEEEEEEGCEKKSKKRKKKARERERKKEGKNIKEKNTPQKIIVAIPPPDSNWEVVCGFESLAREFEATGTPLSLPPFDTVTTTNRALVLGSSGVVEKCRRRRRRRASLRRDIK